jgi:hypothetical protein
MSRRGWIIVSIVAGSAAAVAGVSAGVVAYVHRARQAASIARESFDPYYAIVQYLLTPDEGERARMEPDA